MVFVYIGIAVVVLFLFLVIYYNRKEIIERIKKPKVKQPKNQEDPDTFVDPKRISYNEFDNPTVKEYSDLDEVFNSNETTDKQKLEDLDKESYDMDIIENNYEQLFNNNSVEIDYNPEDDVSYLQQSISIGSHSLTNEKPSIYEDEADDEDDYLVDINLGLENTSIAEKFANLPDDMKALMLADILKKKY